MNNLGLWIRKRRKEKEWSQEHLGELIHAKKQQISDWERGKQIVPLSRYQELATVFGVEIQNLYVIADGGKKTEMTDLDEKFRNIKNPYDAVLFLEPLLDNFEVDQECSVTLKTLLRHFLLMLLLGAVDECERFQRNSDFSDDDYIGWFVAEIESVVWTNSWRDKYGEYGYMNFEREGTNIQMTAGRLFDLFSDGSGDPFVPASDRVIAVRETTVFKCHLLDFARHLRAYPEKKTTDLRDMYCIQFEEDFSVEEWHKYVESISHT